MRQDGGKKKSSFVNPSALLIARCRAVSRALVSSLPGRLSSEFGVNLSSRRRGDLFNWFLAALLYGARISGSIVARTHAEFLRRGLTTPEQIMPTGWLDWSTHSMQATMSATTLRPPRNW